MGVSKDETKILSNDVRGLNKKKKIWPMADCGHVIVVRHFSFFHSFYSFNFFLFLFFLFSFVFQSRLRSIFDSFIYFFFFFFFLLFPFLFFFFDLS